MRILVERKSFCSAFPAWVCCLVYSPLGPDNVSRHLLTRPGRYSARAAYLQPALRSGAFDTVEVTIRVTEPPPYRRALGLSRSRRARTEGAGADDFESRPTTPVTWPPPCRGTIVVPTVTAPVRVEEQADRARNVPYRNLTVSA